MKIKGISFAMLISMSLFYRGTVSAQYTNYTVNNIMKLDGVCNITSFTEHYGSFIAIVNRGSVFSGKGESLNLPADMKYHIVYALGGPQLNYLASHDKPIFKIIGREESVLDAIATDGVTIDVLTIDRRADGDEKVVNSEEVHLDKTQFAYFQDNGRGSVRDIVITDAKNIDGNLLVSGYAFMIDGEIKEERADFLLKFDSSGKLLKQVILNNTHFSAGTEWFADAEPFRECNRNLNHSYVQLLNGFLHPRIVIEEDGVGLEGYVVNHMKIKKQHYPATFSSEYRPEQAYTYFAEGSNASSKTYLYKVKELFENPQVHYTSVADPQEDSGYWSINEKAALRIGYHIGELDYNYRIAYRNSEHRFILGELVRSETREYFGKDGVEDGMYRIDVRSQESSIEVSGQEFEGYKPHYLYCGINYHPLCFSHITRGVYRVLPIGSAMDRHGNVKVLSINYIIKPSTYNKSDPEFFSYYSITEFEFYKAPAPSMLETSRYITKQYEDVDIRLACLDTNYNLVDGCYLQHTRSSSGGYMYDAQVDKPADEDAQWTLYYNHELGAYYLGCKIKGYMYFAYRDRKLYFDQGLRNGPSYLDIRYLWQLYKSSDPKVFYLKSVWDGEYLEETGLTFSKGGL